MKDRFDYIVIVIVIGAGSYGCVTANRLALEYNARILLLEAGPSDNNSLIKIPAASFKMVSGSSPFVKRVASTSQASLGGADYRGTSGQRCWRWKLSQHHAICKRLTPGL